MAMDKVMRNESDIETKILILRGLGPLSKEHATLIMEQVDWDFKRATTARYLAKYQVYIHCNLFCIDK